MASLTQVFDSLQLKEFGNYADIDFGDTERYIPWRPQCPIKFQGPAIKSIQQHIAKKRVMRILGWHCPDPSKNNLFYPIGKFACSVCSKDQYLNPLHDNYAFVSYAVLSNRDLIHHNGLICKSCIAYFPDSPVTGTPSKVSMTITPEHYAKIKPIKK